MTVGNVMSNDSDEERCFGLEVLLFLALDNIDNDNDINEVSHSVSQWQCPGC